jgi:hypothetical protein
MPPKIFLISQMLVGEFYRILNSINMHLDILFLPVPFHFQVVVIYIYISFGVCVCVCVTG